MSEPSTAAPLLYHFCRLRLPGLTLPLPAFARRLERAFHTYRARNNDAAAVKAATLRASAQPSGGVMCNTQQAWAKFVENLHLLDWFLACACLEGIESAWEALFSSRASRTESLLVDALRRRAVRLFPRDPERQEEAVTDFWGFLLAGEREGSVPILARYDGQRPLVPWLIRVFQNKHLSDMRKHRVETPLGDDDMIDCDLDLPEDSDARWHEQFREAAREWFAELTEQEVLLLGLRLRYRLSQREVAKLLGIHEGNVTRRIDALSRRAHERIGQSLRELGWTGDDLQGFIHKEMASVLLEEPRLAVDHLARLLVERGKGPPETPQEDDKVTR
jgi:RNA polymerase sigma factor (sigma-70 family)